MAYREISASQREKIEIGLSSGLALRKIADSAGVSVMAVVRQRRLGIRAAGEGRGCNVREAVKRFRANIQEAQKMRDEGLSLDAIATHFRVSTTTVRAHTANPHIRKSDVGMTCKYTFCLGDKQLDAIRRASAKHPNRLSASGIIREAIDMWLGANKEGCRGQE